MIQIDDWMLIAAKRSKLALVSLSPLFLVVFVAGWIISWIGQLGS